jgi:hypothetical protein
MADKSNSEREPASSGFVNRHLFTILAVGLILVVAVSVRQVNHLFELPRFVPGRIDGVVIGFYVYVAALLLIYGVLGWWVVPFQIRRKRGKGLPPDRETQGRLGVQIVNLLGAHRLLFLVAGAAASVVLLGLYWWLGSRWIEPFSAPFLATLCCLTAAFSAMMLFWNRLDLRTRRLWMRVLTTLLALNLLGEMIWRLALTGPPFSPRIYTLWAILHTAFCVLLFARVVDYWNDYSEAWIRRFALVFVIVAAGRMPPTEVGEVADFAKLRTRGDAPQSEAIDPWLAHLKARLDAIPHDGMPIVLIAASGGGSRAALFTSLVYEYLAQTPIAVSSPTEGFPDSFRVDQHVLLISSVSGGTLASACYVDREYTKKRSAANGRQKTPRNFMRKEIVDLLRDEKNLADLQDIPWCGAEVKRPDANGRSYYDYVLETVKSDDPAALWFLDRIFVDDMCTDFMAPLLRGVLHMPIGRGQAVSRFWESRFGLSETNIGWRSAATASVADGGWEQWPPLLLANVSEVSRGTRLIVGFPPLPPALIGVDSDSLHDARGWINLDPRGDQFVELRLSEAVRLSANFPWGFPVARVGLTPAEDEPPVHLLDGGLVDNTGIDAIRTVFQRLHEWADPKSEAGKTNSPRQKELQRVFEELQKRGVLLVEIDSGAKPQRPGWVASLLSGILEPVGALQNAAYASATAAVDTHLHYLDDFLPATLREQFERVSERVPSPEWADLEKLDEIPGIKRVTITCNHQDNVMTAWALGPNDKAKIFLRFLAGRERLYDQISDYLQLRAWLVPVKSTFDEQEQVAKKDPRQVNREALQKALENYRKLSHYADATQKKQDLELKVENMYYQRLELPQGYGQRAEQQLPPLEPYLKKDRVGENVPKEDQPALEPLSYDAQSPIQRPIPSKKRYQAVGTQIEKYDRGLKDFKGTLLQDAKQLQELRRTK